MLTIRDMRAAIEACQPARKVLIVHEQDFAPLVRRCVAETERNGLQPALGFVGKWGLRLMGMEFYPSNLVPAGTVFALDSDAVSGEV